MMRALSVRPPWAWLLVNGFKKIENRTRRTNQRGQILIHAGSRMTQAEYDHVAAFLLREDLPIQLPPVTALPQGALVGVCELVGCVQTSDSVWFDKDTENNFGWQIDNARAFKTPIPYRGMLGFFNVDMPTSMARNLGLHRTSAK
jgi:ASCH domain